MRARLTAFVACRFMLLGHAHAQQLIAPDIADHAAADFRQMSPPGTEVTIVDALTLNIKERGGAEFHLNLGNINTVCLADPGHCSIALADFVSKAAEMMTEPAAPITKAQLRAVVRSNGYVDGLKRMMKGPEPISTPLVDDLRVVCYLDMPTVMRIATDKDLKLLGLSASAAIELCEKNVESALPPLASQAESTTEQVGILPDDPYESSRFIFPADWKPIAKKFGGNLIVAVPAANVVLYANGHNKESVDAMATLAKKLFEQAQMSVSQKVFRWTPAGWEVVSR